MLKTSKFQLILWSLGTWAAQAEPQVFFTFRYDRHFIKREWTDKYKSVIRCKVFFRLLFLDFDIWSSFCQSQIKNNIEFLLKPKDQTEHEQVIERDFILTVKNGRHNMQRKVQKTKKSTSSSQFFTTGETRRTWKGFYNRVNLTPCDEIGGFIPKNLLWAW